VLYTLLTRSPCHDCSKRIQRAKFDINNCTVKSIDQLFHSRLHCFKVTHRPEDPTEKKVTAVFAAEDEDSLNYWLISFEDCEVYFHTHGGVHPAPEAKKLPPRERSAPSPASVPTEPAVAAVPAQETSNLPDVSPAPAPPAALPPAAAPTGEPGKINPADLMNALKKRNAAKAAIAELNDDEDEPSHAASMHPFAGTLQSRFASAPAVARAQPALAATSTLPALRSVVTPFGSSEALLTTFDGENEALHRVDTMNMDQMFAPGTPLQVARAAAPAAQAAPRVVAEQQQLPLPALAPSPSPSHVPPTPPTGGLPSTASAATLKAPTFDFSNVKLSLKRVHFPAERLARRIKIWYSSSGFSLSTASEVEQFVADLRGAGDKVLTDFAEEKFGDLQDWANLLAVLRKYEQRRLIESPRDPAMRAPGITFDVTTKVKGESAPKEIELLVESTTTGTELCRQVTLSHNSSCLSPPLTNTVLLYVCLAAVVAYRRSCQRGAREPAQAADGSGQQHSGQGTGSAERRPHFRRGPSAGTCYTFLNAHSYRDSPEYSICFVYGDLH
jgi:hypothetical protein